MQRTHLYPVDINLLGKVLQQLNLRQHIIQFGDSLELILCQCLTTSLLPSIVFKLALGVKND